MLKYRDIGGNAGQVVADYSVQLPHVLWPAEAIVTEFILVTVDGDMTAKRGYVWDYATVPLTKKISNKLAGKKSKVPSLAHDMLCQLKRHDLLPQDPTRVHTDRFFYALLLERKFWRVRAWAWYKAVRFGAKHHKQKPRKVRIAP